MKKIDIKKILSTKPTNLDRINFYFKNYQKEPNPNKKLLLLKIIQNFKER